MSDATTAATPQSPLPARPSLPGRPPAMWTDSPPKSPSAMRNAPSRAGAPGKARPIPNVAGRDVRLRAGNVGPPLARFETPAGALVRGFCSDGGGGCSTSWVGGGVDLLREHVTMRQDRHRLGLVRGPA